MTQTLPAIFRKKRPKTYKPLTEKAKTALKVYVRDGRYSANATARLLKMSKSYVKRLVKRADAQRFIELEQKDLGIATRAIRYDVVRETHRVAKATIVDVYEVLNPDGRGIDINNMKNLNPDLRAAVKTIEVDERFVKGTGAMRILERKTRIGMHDKVRALIALSEMVSVKQDKPEDDERDSEMKLVGIVIEGPDGETKAIMNTPTKRVQSAIDADFEIKEPEEDEDEWLKI